MTIIGRRYLLKGRPVTVLKRWGPGGGPRNVLIEREDGTRDVRPFRGVGSEVYCALKFGRRAVGIELKPSYYRQALKNIELAMNGADDGEDSLFKVGQSEQEDAEAISEEDAEEVMA